MCSLWNCPRTSMQAVLNQSGRQQPKLWESGKNAIAFFPRRVQPAVFSISFDSWGGSLSSSNPGSIPDSAEAYLAPKLSRTQNCLCIERFKRHFCISNEVISQI